MDQVIQQSLITAAVQLEQQLDSELNRLETMDSDDLQVLRDQRLKELKKVQQQKQEWLAQGHGEFTELPDEKKFFEVSGKSSNIVCHFYLDGKERCRIVDMHMKVLCKKHIEARFLKVNAEKCPFLVERLKIKVIPTVALIKDGKVKDYIVGFTDLGNRDDFSTEMMEWRIAQSGAIEYNGDLLTPPDDSKKKKFLTQKNKTIRGGYDSDDSDIDFDD